MAINVTTSYTLDRLTIAFSCDLNECRDMIRMFPWLTKAREAMHPRPEGGASSNG